MSTPLPCNLDLMKWECLSHKFRGVNDIKSCFASCKNIRNVSLVPVLCVMWVAMVTWHRVAWRQESSPLPGVTSWHFCHGNNNCYQGWVVAADLKKVSFYAQTTKMGWLRLHETIVKWKLTTTMDKKAASCCILLSLSWKLSMKKLLDTTGHLSSFPTWGAITASYIFGLNPSSLDEWCQRTLSGKLICKNI